jgi:hypothetical protein
MKVSRFIFKHTSCIHTPVGNPNIVTQSLSSVRYDVTSFVEQMDFTGVVSIMTEGYKKRMGEKERKKERKKERREKSGIRKALTIPSYSGGPRFIHCSRERCAAHHINVHQQNSFL